jgi:hypothetical protein
MRVLGPLYVTLAGGLLGSAMICQVVEGQQLHAVADYVPNANTGDSQNMDFPRHNPAVQIISDDAANMGMNSAVTENYHTTFWDTIFSQGSPFYVGLVTGETYDDNIFISQNRRGDFYTHVTPFLDFVRGDKTAIDANYFNVVFRPTFFVYSRFNTEDHTDWYADALYQHTWTRMTLSIEQEFEELTDPSIDVGAFFKRDIYTTTARGSYTYNDKLAFGGSETQRFSYFDQSAISKTEEWITDLYAQYQLGPKLSLGLGPRIGLVDITGAPSQSYEGLLARLSYDVSAKVALNVEAGGEARQFHGAGERVFPVFDFSVNYTPFDGTMLTLSGYRDDVISYSEAGNDYLSTTAQLNLRQRFLEKFYFLLSAGYAMADYQDIEGTSGGGNRRDNYYFVNAGVEWDPREWLSVSARVQYSEDDSNFVQNSFNDSQLNIQSTLQF